MASNWREQAQKHPRVVELRRLYWAKWRRLATDKTFLLETYRLKLALEEAYASPAKRRICKLFFARFAYPTAFHLWRLRPYIKSIRDAQLRTVFWRYVRYVARFGVVMYIRKKKPYFRVTALLPSGPTLHAVLAQGHIRPKHTIDDEDNEPFFESETVDVIPELKSLIRSGAAKYLLIEDQDGLSSLNQMEAVAYHPEGLTVLVHEAEQTYLLCLIGENATTEGWRNMAPVIHELQRKYYEREKAGKPANVRKLQVALNQLRRGGFLKGRAYVVDKTTKIESSQTYISKLRSKLLT